MGKSTFLYAKFTAVLIVAAFFSVVTSTLTEDDTEPIKRGCSDAGLTLDKDSLEFGLGFLKLTYKMTPKRIGRRRKFCNEESTPIMYGYASCSPDLLEEDDCEECLQAAYDIVRECDFSGGGAKLGSCGISYTLVNDISNVFTADEYKIYYRG